MNVSELIGFVNGQILKEGKNLEIKGITADSRKVESGFCFFCLKGTKVDGHDYAEEAAKKGAVAIVCERDIAIAEKDVSLIKVNDSRLAYAISSAAFFGFPSKGLKIIGVTGTNGKTTTTHLIESIFKEAGFATGLIGTVYTRIKDEEIPVTHTTPDPYELQRTLKAMREAGVEVVAMEVSSHAIHQKRIEGTDFSALVFTNLSQDHLDYHRTMEEYARVKMSIFIKNPHIPWILNIDDPVGVALFEEAKKAKAQVITCGIKNQADLMATDIELNLDGVKFNLNFNDGTKARVFLPLGGVFNVYNALFSAASALAIGLDRNYIVSGLEKASQPPGRFETIKSKESFIVVVDYAHTPDGLKNVIEACLNILGGKGRLITVFGCGGDRDRDKRPKMGRIASEKSSLVIVTSDNPRSEEPEAIIKEILSGIDEKLMDKVIVEVDRREAIFKAVSLARSGDIVLIAGKGHETYQVFRDKTIYFNDKEVAREAIQERERKIEF